MTDPDPRGMHFDDDFLFEVVHGLRAGDEVAAAVEHARSCADCDRRLRALAGDRERLRTRPLVAATAGTAAGRSPATGRWRRPGPLASVLAAAAVVAIVASAVVLRAPEPPRAATLPALPASPEVVRLRTPGEEADLPRLERAMESYGRKDWRRVSTLLEAPFATTRLESMRRLYRASALLELGRPAEARELLDPVARTPLPEPYATWRDWACLHASDKPGDRARAESVARTLVPGA